VKNWVKIFSSQTTVAQTNAPIKTSLKESGNVFLMLFGAVAMVGVLGASTMTVLKGPVRTMSQVTKLTLAENNMMTTAKIAVTIANEPSDDCDTDNFLEPDEAGANIAGFNGGTEGGQIPAAIGVQRQDPWGTDYGYCVWDHGTVDDAGCGGAGQNRLAGDNVNAVISDYVIAVISAGPDGNYQTTCNDFTGVGTLITRTSGADDIIFGYTYAEAAAVAGGLWNDDGGVTTAAIERDLSVRTDVSNPLTETLGFTASSGDFSVTGSGEFPVVRTDNIQGTTGVGTNINIDNPIVAGSSITATGNVSAADLIAGGNLDVTGTSTFDGDVTLGDAIGTTLNSTLDVTGNTTFDGDVALGNEPADTVTVNGTLSLVDIDASGNATIDGNTTLGDNAASDTVTMNADTTISGGDLTLSTGNVTLTAGNLSVGGNLDMTGGTIENLAGPPTTNLQAANKKYVDDQVASGAGYTETDPTITSRVANRFCQMNGTATNLLCNVDLSAVETDPTIGTPLTSGRLCTYDGSNIVCNTTSGSVGAPGLFTDNTTHITRENLNIIDLASNSTLAGLDGDGTRTFYAANKSAFRGGSIVTGNAAWQDTNIGSASFGWGVNNLASGNNSFAVGLQYFVRPKYYN